MFAMLRQRDFALLLVARLVSVTGSALATAGGFVDRRDRTRTCSERTGCGRRCRCRRWR